MHLGCPLIWGEIETNQRFDNYERKIIIDNDEVTCKYDSYHFQPCINFFSTMDPPHGLAPNGYSCGESMVMKF